MVITILEASVEEAAWERLRRTYQEKTAEVPEFIVQSYLVQSQSSRTIWRIITAFKDQESLDAMRSSGQTPTGVLIFRAAGAEPALSIFDVATTARPNR